MRVGFCLEQTLGHRAHSANVTAAICASGIDADVLLVDYTSRSRGPWAFRGSWDAASQLRRAKQRHDVRFFHTQSVSLFAPFISRGRPYVVSVDATPHQFDGLGDWYGHNRSAGPMEWVKSRWYRFVFGRASELVAWSAWAAESLVSDYGVPASRVTVVHPGAPREFFEIDGRARNGERPTVLFVGGDLKRKGGDLLLDAVSRTPGLRAVCVTTDDVQPSDRVEVISDATPGSQRLLDAYRRADFFCLPTRGDCTPVVLGEAMAAGLPVVTTRIGSNSETVTDGENGLLVDVDDSAQLEVALATLADDRALRTRMGDAARRTAIARFDAMANAERIFAVLKRAAS